MVSIGCEKKKASGDTSSDSGTGSVVSGGGGGGGNGSSTTIEVGTGLTFSNITKSGFTISWAAATSPTTPKEKLEYQLVTAATTDALATVAEAEAVTPADIVLPYTAGALSHTATGLGPSETHAYAVLVKDSAGNTALYPAASVTTLAPDAPTPGTGITFGQITDTGFAVYWGAATSAVTDQAHLRYRVVMAPDASSISTVAGAQAVTGSNVVLDWTANRMDAQYAPAGSVQGAQTYAVAVLVKDQNDVTAIYTPQTVTTLHHKLIFVTDNLYDPSTLGINSGKIQADDYCESEKPAGSGTFKAMIAIPTVREACRTHANCMNGSTLLKDDGIGWVMAPNTSYENKRGKYLWTTNEAGIVYLGASSLPAAIYDSDGLPKPWTGLTSDWRTGDNCDNWTSNSSSSQANYGLATSTNSSSWGGSPHACNGWEQVNHTYLYDNLYCVEQ